MATISHSYVAGNILTGPADIYIGLPAPASASPPTQANEVAFDSSGQPATVSASITGATNATPIVITFGAFSGSYTPKNGDVAVVSGVGGNTNANNTSTNTPAANPAWTLSSVTATTAVLSGSAGNSAYTSGGTISIGQHLGLAEGPVQFNIVTKFDEIRADQFEGPIDAFLSTADAEIDVNLLEFDPLTVCRWFMNDYLVNEALFSGSKALQFGGIQNFAGDATTLRSLMLVSGNRASIGKWIYVFAYKVYLKSAVQLTFHRTAKNVFKLKFGLVSDLTRVAGDEFFQYVKTK